MSTARHALVGCLGVVLACATPDGSTSSGAGLTVRWTGADTAAFDAPATAERCDTLHLIEIRAISGDTGLGLALYDSGAFQPGSYPIRPPASAERAAPAAALAVRWFSKTAVQGYQGQSGNVTLRRAANGRLSGTFTAKALSINSSARLSLTGSFDGLRLKPAALGCVPSPRDSTASPEDSTAPPPGDSTAPPPDSTARVD
jgi:hypothetical protein